MHISFDDDDGFEWLAAGPVEVRAVSTGSAAEQAGLIPGDRVIAVNGHPMHTAAAGKAFFRAKAGDEMCLDILRDGEALETTLTVRASEEVLAEGSAGAVLRRGERGWGDEALGEAVDGPRRFNGNPGAQVPAVRSVTRRRKMIAGSVYRILYCYGSLPVTTDDRRLRC